MAKPDWPKIKNEYATANISYRKLAGKYGVAFQTLRDRAMRENWGAFRETQRHKIGTKTAQKTAEKISDRNAGMTVEMAELHTIAARRAREMLEGETLNPKGLKSVTSALKDLSDIARATAAPAVSENNLFDAIVGSAGKDIDAHDIPELEQAAGAGGDVVEPPGVPSA